MAHNAEVHAAVRTGVCVTPLMDPADVDWAGLDPTVIQVQLQKKTDTTVNYQS